MRNKKGFTLIELIAVIVVIAIVSLLVVPNIIGVVKNSRESLNERQLDMIIDAAKKYGVANYYSLSETDPTFITLEDLASGGFIESKEIADLTNPTKNFEGCIMSMYSYKRQTYEYKYLESCDKDYYINKVSVSSDYTSGWKKQVNVTVNTEFEASDGGTYFKYCASSSPTCTPTKEVRKKTDTVAIKNQGEHIYVCAASVADTGSQSEVKCVGPFKIDNVGPTLTIPGNENLDSLVTTYDFSTGVSYSDNFTATNQIKLERTGNISLGTLGSYTLTYTATDLAGNTTTKTRTVTVVDVTNPEISITVASNQFNSNGWAKADISAAIKVTDKGGSGAKSYTYCVSKTGECTPNKTVNKTEDTVKLTDESKTNYICAYGTDGAGNKSTPTTCKGPYKLDKTAPDMTYNETTTIGTSIKTYSLHTGVTYNDNLSTSDELTKTITSSVSYGVSGTYTIKHTITDLAGNVRERTRTLIIVDDEKPEISLTVNGSPFNSNGWATSNFKIKVGTSDEGDGVASYTYCTSTTGECTPSTTVNATSGEIEVSGQSKTNWVCGYATDRAGNKSEPTSCVGPYKLDKEGPSISFPASTTIYQSVSSFDTNTGLTVTDNVSSASEITLTSTNDINYNVAGDYTVTYTATDLAGKSTKKKRTVTVVDDIKPELTLSSSCATSGTNSWCKGDVTVTLTIVDKSSITERQYKIGTGSWQTLSSNTHKITTDMNNTVYYKVKDAAGNWSDEKSVTVKRDTKGPEFSGLTVATVAQSTNTFDVWSGVSVSDNFTATADITKSATGNLNFADPKEYTITYTATDKAGNTTTKTRSVTITPSNYTLTVSNQKAAYGSISGTSSGSYLFNTSITVKATPKSGYVFAGWEENGTIISNSATYTFNMPNRNVSIKATYSFDITSISEIKVLQIYPVAAAQNQLKNWMETNGYGQGKIKVSDVLLSDFNANPSNYLKKTGDSWNYHIVFIGTYDCNGACYSAGDLSESSANVIKNYMDDDMGIIVGHDVFNANHPYVRSLKSYFSVDFDNYDSVAGTRSGTKITIFKEGIFTTYPHNIGNVGDVLTIPSTHSSGFVTYGTVWMMIGDHPEVIHGKDGTSINNYFLSTYNNTALIQTGHSNGQATADEQKIIANIIFYMYSQYLMNQ